VLPGFVGMSQVVEAAVVADIARDAGIVEADTLFEQVLLGLDGIGVLDFAG
jgi:hypothetical protein